MISGNSLSFRCHQRTHFSIICFYSIMTRKQKAGLQTHCPKCGDLVITGNEGRHAAYCDERLEVAFLATLTNKSITIPCHSNAVVTNKTNNNSLTDTVACLADPTTNMFISKNQGDGISVFNSPKKRLRSSTKKLPSNVHNDQDNDPNEHFFPSGGSVQSDDMMDITDYKSGLFHEFADQTDRYLYQKQHHHPTVRNYEQLVHHESAQSYYSDTTEQEILHTYYL
jgi:endogenous inhibitor of DNA gyrase (YacG/DUF329 family)